MIRATLIIAYNQPNEVFTHCDCSQHDLGGDLLGYGQTIDYNSKTLVGICPSALTISHYKS